MVRQRGQRVNEAHSVGAGFAHADNSAAAHIDASTADLGQRVEPVFHRPRGNDLVIALWRGIDVMVVVIQARVCKHVRLAWREHPQSHAGFHAHGTHALNDLNNSWHIAVFRVPPRSAHAETA